MIMDKQELERMYVRSLKTKKILFIISMVLFGLATLEIVGFILLYNSPYDVILIPDFLGFNYYLSSLLVDSFTTLIGAGLVLLLFSRIVFARRAYMAKAMLENFDKISEEQNKMWGTMPNSTPIVDVKPVDETKGKYDDLIHEYEKLAEQGVITKEELDTKKKELGYK